MTLLTVVYIACFQLCALPSIVRIVRRGSSADLSIWREVTLLVGVSAQFAVMQLSGVPWVVWISPVLSAVSVLTLLFVIWLYRSGDCGLFIGNERKTSALLHNYRRFVSKKQGNADR